MKIHRRVYGLVIEEVIFETDDIDDRGGEPSSVVNYAGLRDDEKSATIPPERTT